MEVISVNNLTKVYSGGKVALKDLSLAVKEGEIYSLLGPNGAGKSTLIHILTTFCRPSSGEVRVLGKDLCKEQRFLRSKIACVAQKVSIDDHLSLYENLLFQSRLYGIDRTSALKRAEMLIDAFHLKEYTGSRVTAFSGGVKRRLDLAMSLISNPKLLFLDEPTVGLDIESRQLLWNMIKTIQTEFHTTIFLTTHYLEEADRLSDTICILKEGHELVQDSPQQLRNYTDRNILNLRLCEDEKVSRVVLLLQAFPLVQGIRQEEQMLYISVPDSSKDFKAIHQYLAANSVSYDMIGVKRPSLDDIFLALIHDNERSNSYGSTEHLLA